MSDTIKTVPADPYQRALTTLSDMRRAGLVPVVIITRDADDEFRVPSPDGRAVGAYYTDDKQDAEETAAAMWGGPVAIKHRKQR